MTIEEYVSQSCFTEMSNPSLAESIDISSDIKEAVMFGYNKAKKELQTQVAVMKCCGNCKYCKPCVTVNETVGNMCDYYDNGCNNSELEPYNKWEIKE